MYRGGNQISINSFQRKYKKLFRLSFPRISKCALYYLYDYLLYLVHKARNMLSNQSHSMSSNHHPSFLYQKYPINKCIYINLFIKTGFSLRYYEQLFFHCSSTR